MQPKSKRKLLLMLIESTTIVFTYVLT